MATLFTTLQRETRKKASVVVKEDTKKESFSEFREWFSGFHDTYGGYSPKNLEAWFSAVQKSHKDIRDQINGIRLHKTYKLPEYKGPASEEDCDGLIRSLLRLMPYYLSDTRLTKEHLLSGSTPNGMRAGKRIMQYANSIGLAEANKIQLTKIISGLGDKWANAKTSAQDITVTISTAAKAFASIGHYGPDDVSCFKQTGTNANNKYNLAMVLNTFVVLLRTNPGRIHEPLGSRTILARLWGFFNFDNNVVNFCNYYPAKSFMEGNAFQACKHVAATMLGCSVDDINCEKNRIYVTTNYDIYHNNKETQPNWSFFVGDKTIDTQEL